MCKIFNKEIISSLCAKNVNKIINKRRVPIVSTINPRRKNGEEYVIFLNQRHQKELDEQIDTLERNNTAKQLVGGMGDTVHGATTHPDPVNAAEVHYLIYWVKTFLNNEKKKIFVKDRLTKSIVLISNMIKQSFSSMQFKSEENNEQTKRHIVTPVILGAFLDEPICAIIDHILYAIFYMFGWRLVPKEDEDED